MKKGSAFESILATILVLLWVYTAGTKLADFNRFRSELFNQVFSNSFASILLYIVPAAEFIAAVLLIQSRTRLIGFALSSFLMVLFTGYVALVLIGYYDRVPCSCAGIIENMGWHTHLLLNIFFTAIAIAGFIITTKKGGT